MRRLNVFEDAGTDIGVLPVTASNLAPAAYAPPRNAPRAALAILAALGLVGLWRGFFEEFRREPLYAPEPSARAMGTTGRAVEAVPAPEPSMLVPTEPAGEAAATTARAEPAAEPTAEPPAAATPDASPRPAILDAEPEPTLQVLEPAAEADLPLEDEAPPDPPDAYD